MPHSEKHTIGGLDHTPDTLANLNSRILDGDIPDETTVVKYDDYTIGSSSGVTDDMRVLGVNLANSSLVRFNLLPMLDLKFPELLWKNENITKAQIEAKLIGEILSHTHPRAIKVHYAESLAESSTNLETYQLKLALDLPVDFEAGDYFIEVNYGWNLTGVATHDFMAIVELDNVQIGDTHQEKTEDSGISQRRLAHRRFKQTLTAGTHTISIDYKTSGSLGTAYIRDANISVTKINIQS